MIWRMHQLMSGILRREEITLLPHKFLLQKFTFGRNASSRLVRKGTTGRMFIHSEEVLVLLERFDITI